MKCVGWRGDGDEDRAPGWYRSPMQSPVNLAIWNRSIELAVRVNHLAMQLPSREAPGLANQMRRASSSIPANIAEGSGQESPAQFARFVSIAIASAFELESHLVLAQRLQPTLPDATAVISEVRQIRKMMHSFREHQLKKVRELIEVRKAE